MHVPLPVLVVGGIAVGAVILVFVFLMLAAVRMLFAMAELLGGLLLVGVVVFIVYKVFLESSPEESR